MTQTLAIFLDAYRSLNAKKMFWIVLAISGLVVLACAMLGINERGLTVFGWQLEGDWFRWLNSDVVPPALLYKVLFVQFGVYLWLSWVATILALVSTAGIFPDLISSGSIDLVLCKPISRLRLFVTQYLAGLLFVTLQVIIFCVASFLVIGIRGGAWEPSLFVAVPLVVCFFSYLFSVCVFLGIATRSTLAALLLTLLFWFFVYAIGAAELLLGTTAERGLPGLPPQAEQAAPDDDLPQATGGSRALKVAHQITFALKTAMPKTTETIALLERDLVSMAELPEPPNRRRRARADFNEALQETMRSRPVWWVVGTSLLFELFVLAWAAWIFCRRDF